MIEKVVVMESVVEMMIKCGWKLGSEDERVLSVEIRFT